MTISYRDRRTLHRIEQDLTVDDPDLARWLGDPSRPPSIRHQLAPAAAGFVAGTIALATTLYEQQMLLLPIIALALIVGSVLRIAQLLDDLGPTERAARLAALGAALQLIGPTSDRRD